MAAPDSSFLRRFLHDEAAGGIALVAATVAALVWANVDHSSYEDVWHGGLDLRHWVNEGLMALFFFVVGLEVRRELRTVRTAMLPVVAALGGMVVPAALYLAVAGGRGWGIPMATDIAFAVGVLALLGRRVPAGLKVFLLTLAVVDDIGAVLVIALFYGGGLHSSVVAVATAFLVPRRAIVRLEAALHPWTSFVIVPVFALANAGVELDLTASRVSWGVFLGLVVGKPLGIVGASWLAVRLRMADLPRGVRWPHVVGGGTLAGIGFTVSLFVAGLAFDDAASAEAAKVAILAASLAAACLGAAALTFWRAKT